MTTSDLARLRATAEEVMRLNDDNMKRAAPKFARGVRQELAAGVVLRSGGRSAFGGKLEKHTPILSLTAFDPGGHLEAFTRLAYRP